MVGCAKVGEIVKRPEEGATKLWLIHRILTLRKARPALFGSDALYELLRAAGRRANHVVAFMRGSGAITVVPRLVLGLGSRWEDTSIIIPSGRWRNELGDEMYEGGQVALTKLMARFPVCLLVREEATR